MALYLDYEDFDRVNETYVPAIPDLSVYDDPDDYGDNEGDGAVLWLTGVIR